ncbi:uncharacterized protein [Dendropsophus ebraccatus]|uniref:uncharacterized protein isoform X2 n=1 Tax=Dendropsophus ebraccatus TaxID=150705 RepID=UPI003831DD8D
MPHEKLNMVSSPCCWVLLLLCPNTNAYFCSPTRTLTIDQGEDVILQSNHSRTSYITWDFQKHLIATTIPGRALKLEDYSYKYLGRLFSTRNGSLVITNLTAEDGQIYRADLLGRNSVYLCVQVYDLRTDDRGGVPPSVDPTESCSPTKLLYRRVGESVTLELPSHSGLAYAIWDINNIDHIAITRPGGVTYRQDPGYNGRISVTMDASLKLSHLTGKDQRVYRAEHFTSLWGHLCTQYYNITVNEKEK